MLRSLVFVVLLSFPLIAGCERKQEITREVAIEFRLAEREPGDERTAMVWSGWGHKDTFFVYNEIVLTEKDISSAAVTTMNDMPAIDLRLSEQGAEKFARSTAANIGRHMGILVNGRLLSAPLIRDTVAGGRALIVGDFAADEARRIADALSTR